MTRDRLPDGRRYLTLPQVAEALGLPDRTIRSWCESGQLEYKQLRRNARRLVSIQTLNDFEASGWAVDWLSLED